MHPHIGPLLNKKSAIYMLNLLSIGNPNIRIAFHTINYLLRC
nr:MAG TPA: hypothetical protein [Caudoviricetes sp.]